MRFTRWAPAVLTGLTAAALTSAAAQTPRVVRLAPAAGGRGMGFGQAPRAVIGVSTSSSASSRDTLGVLVSSVREDSPAEKAGIVEGDRIASINGVSLKLSPADVGDDEMANVLNRRLTRELDRVKPGDDVDLTVYSNGHTKSVKVKTVSPDDLYMSRERRAAQDRPTLGISLATTGSPRDTLGVFVMSVVDGGPAAKAGIEEGSRIASINGVDVRGHAPDPDDYIVFRNSTVNRLEREISRLKPGDDVELRVYYNGQYRTVKTKVARAADLPRHRNTMMITSDASGFDMGPAGLDIDLTGVGDQVRRAMDEARLATSTASIAVGRGLGAGFGFGFGRTIEW